METDFRRVVGSWIRDAPRQRTHDALSIHEHETPRVKGLLSRCQSMNARRPTSWWKRLSLTLTAKDAQSGVNTWTWDAPPLYVNPWVWWRQRAQKLLLKSLIRWGVGDRRMVYHPKEDGFRGQGLFFHRICVWIPSYIVCPFSFEYSWFRYDIYTNFLWWSSEHKFIFETWKDERLREGSWTDITLENIKNYC